MIIAPLVFSTLVVGVAHMGDTKAVGRIGAKAMLWFVSASFVSLVLGMVLVNILQPGDNLDMPLRMRRRPRLGARALNAEGLRRPPRAALDRRGDGRPTRSCRSSSSRSSSASPAPRWATRPRRWSPWIEEISHVILKVTGYIMLLAPVAVFASMAAIITTQGLGILVTYGMFVAEFYLGLAILWVLLASSAS